MSDSNKISVIIVNYNVEYFLEQCLNAVFAALKDVQGEVFVVDNDSIDHSVSMVREKFPAVKLIANKKNVGFSKANNQAINQASGEYILLLNPDTVVEEDTFVKCIDFMDKNPEAGGLGVRMIDGKGNFLPESKRGLPTPSVAFYKIFGISRLFPKSKRFGRYHLGFLSQFETNEVDVLSGAYMFMRKAALDKVGLLDESFFMYGEDIDLSYRITKGGYKNYYFPETQIIHYKGESTKKSSINYVFVFYRAMVIFAKKHFSQKNAKLFSFLINLAIYFRAGLALLSRFIKKAFLPIVDFGISILLLVLITKIWEKEHIAFPIEIIKYAIPSYALVWLLSIYYSGGYDKPIRLINALKGTIIGTAIILIVYALLPKDLQFSRLYILLGASLILSYFIFSRVLLHFSIGKKFDLKEVSNKRFGIIGSTKEVERVQGILKQSSNNIEEIIVISPTRDDSDNVVGSLEQLDQIVHIHKLDELIFCAKDISAEAIIKWMSKIASEDLEFKIAQPNSLYLIGSNSVDTSGDLYALEIDKITRSENKRNKRTFDFLLSILFLLVSPVLCLFYKNKSTYFKNLFNIFLGNKSFVGYYLGENIDRLKLPKIKQGILHPFDEILASKKQQDLMFKLNLIYAKDYSIFKDFKILWKNWLKLDR